VINWTGGNDERAIRLQSRRKSPHTRFGNFYDTLRSKDVIGKISDTLIVGSQVVTNGTIVVIQLITPKELRLRLAEWPDAVQAHIVVRHFSICPLVATGTGCIQCVYFAPGGASIPLGDFSVATGGITQNGGIDPYPTTDPTPPQLGSISVNYQGGTAAITFSYSIGFSFAYYLPTQEPYEHDNE